MPIKNASHSQQLYDPTDESIMAEQELCMERLYWKKVSTNFPLGSGRGSSSFILDNVMLLWRSSYNRLAQCKYVLLCGVHQHAVISPEFPLRTKHSDIKKDAAASGWEVAASFLHHRANGLSDWTAPNECDAFSLRLSVRQECASRPSGLNFP